MFKLTSKFLNSTVKRIHSKTVNRGVKVLLKGAKFRKVDDLVLKNKQSYLIRASTYGRLNTDEIEATRKVLRRLTNRKRDRLFVHVHPGIPLTKKPTQARMGRGKGSRTGDFVAFVQPGKILFEIESTRRVSVRFLESICAKARVKLSIRTHSCSLKRLTQP